VVLSGIKMLKRPQIVECVKTILIIYCFTCRRSGAINLNTEVKPPYVDAFKMTQLVQKLSDSLSEMWSLIKSDKISNTDKEEALLLRIKNFNMQITNINDTFNKIGDKFITIQTMSKTFSKKTNLVETLNKISSNQNHIDKLYNELEKYITDFEQHNITTNVKFTNNNSVAQSMEAIHNFAIAPDFLESLLKHAEPGNRRFFCKNHQSSQQVLNNFLSEVILTSTKGHILVQAAYIMKRLYSKGNIVKEPEAATGMFKRRTNNMITTIKSFMAKASREMWRCTPDRHIPGDTYTEINFFHGYIENSETQRCYSDSDQKVSFCCKTWSTEPICSKVMKCELIHNEMDVCLSSIVKNRRRYEYVEFKNGPVFGRNNDNCTHRKTRLESFPICPYHFCVCVEDPRFFSDRYINLLMYKTDMIDNRVVTGVRFVKHNRIIHLQVQEGQLLPKGQIDPDTIRWIPPENYSISDAGLTANTYFEVSLENRSLDLRDVMADEGFVITGVGFRNEGRLKLEIQTTPFNFTTGELTNPENLSVTKMIQRTHLEIKFPNFGRELKLDKPDIPTRCATSAEYRTSNTFIKFTHTGNENDAAQTTVPFFDTQPVVPAVPLPLSAIGIYHKGGRGCGGFVAPRIFTSDFTKYLKAPFPLGG
jgi:hypothetical protein